MNAGFHNTHQALNPVRGKKSLVQWKLPGINSALTPAMEVAGILGDLVPITGTDKQRV